MRRFNDLLILSIFPGIDLLGMAFEQAGFCVVRGPDLITGSDIRHFHPPKGRFDGLIGGPPCQPFSLLNRHRDEGAGRELLAEYERVVAEAEPAWFLYENVKVAPSVRVEGYTQQRFGLDLAWFTPFSRARDFVFGSQGGVLLDPMQGRQGALEGGCVTSRDARSFQACCEIMGLPRDFDLPGFHQEGKKQAVANGVPLLMGRYVASLIAQTIYGDSVPSAAAVEPERRCGCGCGRRVLGQAVYSGGACRKRAERARKRHRWCGCGCGVWVQGKARYGGAACRKRAQRQRDRERVNARGNGG